MMYHRSIGTRYTAKKSTLARAYRSRLAPTTLHVYDPFLLNVVDFTCTRKNLPLSSTPTSYAAESPCGLDTLNPRSAARAIKHNSAHSPRSLHVLKELLPVFIAHLRKIKTRPAGRADFHPL